MNSADNYDPERGAYCRCCGSQDVMTLDRSIEEASDWERQSRLRKKRLIRAIAGLHDLEISDFVFDVVPHINVEEGYEVEAGLESCLFGISCDEPYRYRLRKHDGIELDDIQVEDEECALRSRKAAFLRIWEGFDCATRASFLRRIASSNAASGGAA
ncbi:MAG: hypothetical protein HKN30_03965 [Sulfitobacter sp.]|nr:hypothetical protein [Sulfitobacter sp.]